MQNDHVRADAAPAGDDVDLREYGAVLWRRRWPIAALTVVAGAATLALGLSAPRIFEARTVVIAPPLVDRDELRSTRVFAFESAVQNPKVVEKALADASTAGFQPDRFARENLSVEPGRENNTVILVVRMPGRDAASRVADRLAVLAIERLRSLSEEETKRTQPLLASQVEEARGLLERSAADLRSAARRAGIRPGADQASRGAVSPADPLYNDDPALTQLAADYHVARDLYEDFSARLRRATVEQRARAEQYRVRDPAIASASPVGPRVLRTTIIAAFLAFVGGVFLVLLIEAVRRSLPAGRR